MAPKGKGSKGKVLDFAGNEAHVGIDISSIQHTGAHGFGLECLHDIKAQTKS